MIKVKEILEQKDSFPLDGEAYVVGQTEDGRYFFAWGWEYPKDNELPEKEVLDGANGFQFYNTEEEALGAMREAEEAAEQT